MERVGMYRGGDEMLVERRREQVTLSPPLHSTSHPPSSTSDISGMGLMLREEQRGGMERKREAKEDEDEEDGCRRVGLEEMEGWKKGW